MRRALSIGLLSLALTPAALCLAPQLASACSCMRSPGALDAARGSDVVFSAKLVSVADAPASGPHAMPTKLYTFTVTQTYKGQLDTEVRVSTATNSAACGRNYGDPGSEWLLYASSDGEGQLRDNLCSRTMALADASADITELEANADNLDQAPEPEPQGPGPADPEPMPIDPDGPPVAEGVDGPEPVEPGKKGCSVVDPGFGSGGLASVFGLGLLLAWRRREQ